MTKKYEITEYKNKQGLFQIRALRDFGDISAGEFGGYIQNEYNLSQDGNCWVYENARVSEYAHIYGNARVHGHSWVFGNAQICGNVQVFGQANIAGSTNISGYAVIS